MIELDKPCKTQMAFDEWADSLPINGETGLPIITKGDLDTLISQACNPPGWRGCIISCRREEFQIISKILWTVH
jgi:hypothetical protein